MVSILGKITASKGADGKVDYRAMTLMNRKYYPLFSESKKEDC